MTHPPAPAAAPGTAHLQAMTAADLPLVAEVDKTAYAHPWTLRQFEDSLRAGYWMQLLLRTPDPSADPPGWAHAPALPDGRWLLGYLVAMPGVDETHLLNLTTVPLHQRQGHAQTLLRALREWSLGQGAATVWLEVRASNRAARALYARTGFASVGVRKGYYPDHGTLREDALVMKQDLLPTGPAVQ